MSNIAMLIPTKFVDLSTVDGQSEERISWGFRICDDYGKSYCNYLDKERMEELVANRDFEKIFELFEEEDAMHIIESIRDKGFFDFGMERIQLPEETIMEEENGR